MKFKVGDKVVIAKVDCAYNRRDKRFIGSEWEVWEVRDNDGYILSFGAHRIWRENDLISVKKFNLQKAVRELKKARRNIDWLEGLDFKDEINKDLELLIGKLEKERVVV